MSSEVGASVDRLVYSGDANNLCLDVSNESVPIDPSDSGYYIPADESQLSQNVDSWMRRPSMESTGVQPSRTPLVQRSTLTAPTTVDSMIWYLLALIFPIFSVQNCSHISTMLSTLQILFAQARLLFSRAKVQFQRLAQQQAARDLFGTAMDIVLVIYAIGFLILSTYQSTLSQ